MIGFVVCVGDDEVFAEHAARSYRRVAEPDSQLGELTADGSIHAAYNEALDHFAACDDLEALVLMHQDIELADPGFCGWIRGRFADPQVAVLGTIGAAGVDSLAWWAGEPRGYVLESRGYLGTPGTEGEADAVDGMLMVLSPWAVRNLRFDTDAFSGFHGYDVDYCFSARAAGRTVVAADLRVIHHTKGGFGERAAWDACDMALRRKWSLPLLTPAVGHDSAVDDAGAPRSTADGADAPPTLVRVAATLLVVLHDEDGDAAAAARCLESLSELDAEQPRHGVAIVAEARARALDPLLDQLDGDVVVLRPDQPADRVDRAIAPLVARCPGEIVVVLRGLPRVDAGFLAPLCRALQFEQVAGATSATDGDAHANPGDAMVLAARRSDLSGMLGRLAAADDGATAGFSAICAELERFGTVATVGDSRVASAAPSLLPR
ncbi:glycosyltransferase [Conexibacter sp. CPCC 206217]|uniref:glycosyltransferase n=1 Tax=Conexibacter sp. CPCC 206217 TaxID=3064574 RepID=UPI00271AA4C9|nr:glycosyltransferase [Conexibacter sp. CPCC 206217]MDO8211381.1 glycosyltransferase [Conexibacter sp. CPCC 206217]